MFKKRATQRYQVSPEPVTPYQKAAQVWDERLGSARVQAKNWRLMAFGCLALTAVLTTGLLWLGSQSRIEPYVVEVDALGATKAVGPAVQAFEPTDAQIAYHLSQFITNVRSISIDPIVVRESWLAAYDYATDRAAISLNEYARDNDPFAAIGERSVSTDVTSVVRASDRSFQVKWIERRFRNGALESTERYTAILTIVIQPPRRADQLRKNPLGIYVHGLDWSRDLDTGDAS